MKRISSLFIVIMVLLFTSCKPQIPGEYIQPGDMEDILYDYSLSQAIARANNKTTQADYEYYKQAVLKKYGVSDAEFESSLRYYTRHTEMLHEMYQNISERLKNEAIAQGASESDINQFGDISEKGDTTNIWSGTKAFVLIPHVAENIQSFKVKADTAFHKGDRIIMSYKSQYMVQNGSRDAIAVLTVTFGNDSVTSVNQRIYSDGPSTLSIEDNKKLGIKKVAGYIMINRPDDGSTSLRLVCIYDLKLLRMHIKEIIPQHTGEDSLGTPPVMGSMGMRIDEKDRIQ